MRLQPVLRQIHISHNVRPGGSGAVGQFRAAKTGMEFLRNGAAADYRPAFEHEGLESSFGEIEGGDQPVVSCAEDNDVALFGHRYFVPLECFRISSAARRPGAPMMPPPGCVADPHIHRFLIGVLYCAKPGTGRRKNNCSSESSPWKMLPSVSPHSRSRSSGVTTWRPTMMFFRFGANSAMVSTTLSPNASFFSSHVPSFSLYGAYCTKHDMTCLPGGATDGSVRLGMTMSMYGRREKWPYLASSYARSMYSIFGEMDIAPRRCAPTPGSA